MADGVRAPTRVRPSVRGCVVLVGAVAFEGVGLATASAWPHLLACGLLGLLLAAALLPPPLHRGSLQLARTRPVRAGEPAPDCFHLHNRSHRYLPPTQVTATGGGGPLFRWWVPGIAAEAAATVESERTVYHRGVHRGETLTWHTTAPLGLLTWSRRFTSAVELVVWPALATAFPLPAVPTQRPVSAGLRTGERAGLREYRHGDSARDISARASARRGRAIVLEREPQAPPKAVLLVVAGPGEQGLARLCASGEAALHQGKDIGLLWQDRSGGALRLWARGSYQLLNACARITRPAPPDPAVVAAMVEAYERVHGRGEVLVLWPDRDSWEAAVPAPAPAVERAQPKQDSAKRGRRSRLAAEPAHVPAT